jgi:hypothetical protein
VSMEDPTETIRIGRVAELTGQVESNDKDAERKRLEALHGQVWNTDELGREFDVIGFAAPLGRGPTQIRRHEGKPGIPA